jgi:Skp family chaperone for outer membrane proteins
VKKLFLSLSAAVLCAGVALAPAPAFAQAGAAPAAKSTHQVGLIDMAFVFKNYDKFKTMTKALQEEAQGAQKKADAMIEEMKSLQSKLQGGDLAEGSPDYVRIESQLLKMQTDLETYRKVSQRDFLRKEADIYKTIYLEVQTAVNDYADYYKYTLILRFNRQEVSEADNPQQILNSLGRQVVFYRKSDDLTTPILQYLNDEFKKNGGTAPAAAAPPTRSASNAPR